MLLLFACVQPEVENIANEAEALTAYTDPQTKTSLGAGVEGIYDVNWTLGDAIVATDGGGESVYTTESEGTPEGFFIPKTKTILDFSRGVIAGYPADKIFLGTPDPEEDIYITIPDVQQYIEGSFADRSLPMVSDVTYEPVLQFRNAAGVLRMIVSGEEQINVKSIVIASDEYISGDLCYNPGSMSYVESDIDGGFNKITIECAEEVTVGSEAIPFHAIMPHQTYSNMSISITASDGRVHTFNLREGKQISLERGSIVNIPLHFKTFGTSNEPEIKCSTTYTSFTNFGISLSMKNVDSYYCGLEEKGRFERDLASGELLESINVQTLYTDPRSYNGAISRFQKGFSDILIEQGHEYVFWIVPYKENGNYSAEDIFRHDVMTKSYEPGGTIKLSASDIESDMTSVSMTLTASEKAGMVYNMLFPTSEMEQFANEEEMVKLLLSGSAYFFERDSDIVIRKFLSPGTSYTLIAIAVDKMGKYGELFTQEITTVPIPYNDSEIVIEKDLEALRNDQTIRWNITGGSAAEYRYIITPTDKYLWTGTLESSVKKSAETLFLDPGLYYITRTTDASAKVSMENGKEYVFVILAVDETGSSSAAANWFFTY